MVTGVLVLAGAVMVWIPYHRLVKRVDHQLAIGVLPKTLNYYSGSENIAPGVRARGFELPAAGKTGTSHDGWFAGFTSQLLCLVWVGFDDYSDLKLEGARSALPIWTEFMIEAARYKQYSDAKPFLPPPGVVRSASADQAGSSNCQGAFPGYFIDGTEPPSAKCVPPDVQVFATADGGVTEESRPAQMTPIPGNAPEPSITVETPTVETPAVPTVPSEKTPP